MRLSGEAGLKVLVRDVDHILRSEARGGPGNGPRQPFSGRKQTVGSPTPQTIDISCANPPEEVLDQMAHADEINSRLRESGYQISFALSADGMSLHIELRDISGALLRILSAEEAVAIAAGGPVE
jgi:hypothetical protein